MTTSVFCVRLCLSAVRGRTAHLVRPRRLHNVSVHEPFERLVARPGAPVLAALTAYPQLPPDANIEAWLVTIAHRTAIDLVRAVANVRLDPLRGCRNHRNWRLPMNVNPDPAARDLVSAVPAPTDDELDRLHARLAVAAEDAGVLDVAYRTLDTPVGTLLLAATEHGLVRVAFAAEGVDAVLASIAARVSPRILRAPRRLDEAARQLGEYFEGRRRGFDLPLDLALSSGFRRTVLVQLRQIGYGHTATYAAVAVAAGRPRAVRAVGSACATNPLPVVVPCHRVVRSDGSIGQYLGGVDAKRALLRLESAA